MVLEHVLHRPCAVVIGGSALEGEVLQPADVDPLDALCVPGRCEHSVQEAQGHHSAHQLVAEEVVDPEDHGEGEPRPQDLIEPAGRCQVGAERLLDGYGVVGAQPCRGEGLEGRLQERRWQGKVDSRVLGPSSPITRRTSAGSVASAGAKSSMRTT